MKLLRIPALIWVFPLLFCVHGCRDESTVPQPSGPAFLSPILFIQPGLLHSPRGIAVDSSGDVWVSDTYGDRLLRFSPSGVQVASIPGLLLPAAMGNDRSTGDILAVANGFSIVRVNPQTGGVSIITTLSAPAINSAAVFDVLSRRTRSLTLQLTGLGDIDATMTGDIWVSALANGSENHLLRHRGGTTTDMAVSQVPPVDSVENRPRFVSVDRFGTVFTAFVLPDSRLLGAVRPYLLPSGDPTRSRSWSGASVSGGAMGSGIDEDGVVYVADTRLQEVRMLSTLPEGMLGSLAVPPVPGLAEPAPTDIAVGGDGSLYVTLIDLLDTGHRSGAVLKYPRSESQPRKK